MSIGSCPSHLGAPTSIAPARADCSRKGREWVEAAAELLLLRVLDGAIVDHLLESGRLLGYEIAVGEGLRHHLDVVLALLALLRVELARCLLRLLEDPLLLLRVHELLREGVHLFDLPWQSNPRARFLLDEAQKVLFLFSPEKERGDADAALPFAQKRYWGKSSLLMEKRSLMSELSLSPYSDTPTSHTRTSADDSPTVFAKSFHASCSSP